MRGHSKIGAGARAAELHAGRAVPARPGGPDPAAAGPRPSRGPGAAPRWLARGKGDSHLARPRVEPGGRGTAPGQRRRRGTRPRAGAITLGRGEIAMEI